ncbi:hypothetical protein D3C81_963430 [compost metagenome]
MPLDDQLVLVGGAVVRDRRAVFGLEDIIQAQLDVQRHGKGARWGSHFAKRSGSKAVGTRCHIDIDLPRSIEPGSCGSTVDRVAVIEQLDFFTRGSESIGRHFFLIGRAVLRDWPVGVGDIIQAQLDAQLHCKGAGRGGNLAIAVKRLDGKAVRTEVHIKFDFPESVVLPGGCDCSSDVPVMIAQLHTSAGPGMAADRYLIVACLAALVDRPL